MGTIALVACAKTKANKPLPAAELYKSALFEKAKTYARNRASRWFILSAKHGLLDPTKVISPYDKTLKSTPRKERAAWSDKVFEQLRKYISPKDRIIFLAGKNYREFLEEKLRAEGFDVQIPMHGVPLGKQLQLLDRLNASTTDRQHVERFYALLERLRVGLNDGRLLRNCQASSGWPDRGVYFLFEPNEFRNEDRNSLRVIRVGTHAVSKNAKSTLWGRLATHRGTVKGGGSHRSSIFRLHVGQAMIMRSKGTLSFPTWGQGQNAPKEIRDDERSLEREVTLFIGGIRVLWLNIPDGPGPDSDRAFIERNCIALLSNSSLNPDRPSKSWLGLFSPKKEIRRSGLWNVNHVGERFDERLFPVLERYVEITLGRERFPSRRLAPRNWYQSLDGKSKFEQLPLI